MRTWLYRLTFIAVATCGLFALWSRYAPEPVQTPIRLLGSLGETLPSSLFLFPFTPVAAILVYRWLLVLLVVHRLFRVFQDRAFNTPQSFGRFGVLGAGAGLASCFLGAALVIAGNSGGGASHLGGLLLIVAFHVLPIVFFVVEIMSLLRYVQASKT